MDVKIGGNRGSSRSSSRSSSPKDIGHSRKVKQPLAKSYRNRNASSSPEHKASKGGSQSRSPSRDKQSSPSKSGSTRRRSGSKERRHKRKSRSPSRESKHSRDKRHQSSREKKLGRVHERRRSHSRDRRRSHSHERKRSHSRERRFSPAREKKRSQSRERRRSYSRDIKHSPGRDRDRRRSSSRDRLFRDRRHSPIGRERRHSHEKRSPSFDKKRSSPHRERKASRSHSQERNKKGHSHSHSPEPNHKEKRLKERCRDSPVRHYRKRSRSISPRKIDAKKFKEGPSSKTVEMTRDGPDNEKPSSLPLNLNPEGVALGQAVTPQLLLQQTMAAVSAQAAGITGVPLPKYYNPTAVNPLKYAEQMQKRKLLWQGTKEKTEPTSSNIWQKTTFNEDQDGKMTAKFRKLMGIKEKGSEEEEEEGGEVSGEPSSALLKQEALFRDLDQQYEVARISTHTQRGVGLGYSGHPTLIFPK